MASISLDKLDITELPIPPQGALAVVHACAQDEMDADGISALVEQVPALSVELLRLELLSNLVFKRLNQAAT